jgi:retinoblastoma-like protein 1
MSAMCLINLFICFSSKNLLEQEVFHQTLFACCLEIVIYSYNSQRIFPWVLEALNLESYYFYKVIEVIVKVEDQLSRDMVKHLNMVRNS